MNQITYTKDEINDAYFRYFLANFMLISMGGVLAWVSNQNTSVMSWCFSIFVIIATIAGIIWMLTELIKARKTGDWSSLIVKTEMKVNE